MGSNGSWKPTIASLRPPLTRRLNPGGAPLKNRPDCAPKQGLGSVVGLVVDVGAMEEDKGTICQGVTYVVVHRIDLVASRDGSAQKEDCKYLR